MYGRDMTLIELVEMLYIWSAGIHEFPKGLEFHGCICD
jgi:hypothetical protein